MFGISIECMDRYVKYDASDHWAGAESICSGGGQAGVVLFTADLDPSTVFRASGCTDVPDGVGCADIFVVRAVVLECVEGTEMIMEVIGNSEKGKRSE